jgi:hypothetical protein
MRSRSLPRQCAESPTARAHIPAPRSRAGRRRAAGVPGRASRRRGRSQPRFRKWKASQNAHRAARAASPRRKPSQAARRPQGTADARAPTGRRCRCPSRPGEQYAQLSAADHESPLAPASAHACRAKDARPRSRASAVVNRSPHRRSGRRAHPDSGRRCASCNLPQPLPSNVRTTVALALRRFSPQPSPSRGVPSRTAGVMLRVGVQSGRRSRNSSWSDSR